MGGLITLCEYQHLCASKVDGTRWVSQDVFDSLEMFLVNLNADSEDEASEYKDVFQISSRGGVKTLAVQNHVGVITCGDTTIEILPKVAKGDMDSGDVEQYRKTLLHMLAFLDEIPVKQLSYANIDERRDLPIFEFFISLFLDEVDEVIKRGLRSDYIEVEGNERFLKGRMDFVEQIRLNHSDASRFAQRYSVYHVNRPENRLIKTAVEKLRRVSGNDENRRRMRIISEFLDEVELSNNVKTDFRACGNDRNAAHYDAALRWTMIFLSRLSPVPMPGTLETRAFLFPMETVFESYVASRLKDACRRMGITIKAQFAGESLVRNEKTQRWEYQLVPDMMAIRISDKARMILDTKWKMTDGQNAVGPSQADMYQMFAYAARYDVDDVVLVYPHTDSSPAGFRTCYSSKVGSRPIRIHTYYYDLPIDESVAKTAADELACAIEDVLQNVPRDLTP